MTHHPLVSDSLALSTPTNDDNDVRMIPVSVSRT